MKTIEKYIDCIKSNVAFKIGGNANENTQLVLDSAPTDIWFHVAEYPSAHVVAKIPDTLINEPNKILLPIITQGAVICKQVSKYASKRKLQIIYTKIINVHPTDILGTVSLTTSKDIII